MQSKIDRMGAIFGPFETHPLFFFVTCICNFAYLRKLTWYRLSAFVKRKYWQCDGSSKDGFAADASRTRSRSVGA